jgi:hypothetical protein
MRMTRHFAEWTPLHISRADILIIRSIVSMEKRRREKQKKVFKKLFFHLFQFLLLSLILDSHALSVAATKTVKVLGHLLSLKRVMAAAPMCTTCLSQVSWLQQQRGFHLIAIWFKFKKDHPKMQVPTNMSQWKNLHLEPILRSALRYNSNAVKIYNASSSLARF